MTYEERTVPVVTRRKCVLCGLSAELTTVEGEEFISIRHTCGWGSIFGDGNFLRIDICQYCFKKLLLAAKIPLDKIVVGD